MVLPFKSSLLFLCSVSVFLCLLCVCGLGKDTLYDPCFFLLLSQSRRLFGTLACIFVCMRAYDCAYIFTCNIVFYGEQEC